MPVIKVKSREVKIKVPLTTLRIEPTTQTKTVEPSIEEQIIIPDEGIFALSSVTVNPVTSEIDESIKAENIKEGVSILGVEGTVKPFKEPVLQDKTVNPTSEIQEIVADEGYDGLNRVVVNAQTGVDINDYLETTITTANARFFFTGPIFKKMPSFNLETTDCTLLFSYYKGNIIPQLDTSNVTSFSSMFAYSTITEIPELYASSANNVNGMFLYCKNIVDFGGLKNLGQAYLTTFGANNSRYGLHLADATKLTEQSLINVLNGLYDIAAKGCNAQRCNLGSTNLAKLTSVEGQQALARATEKGWTVS